MLYLHDLVLVLWPYPPFAWLPALRSCSVKAAIGVEYCQGWTYHHTVSRIFMNFQSWITHFRTGSQLQEWCLKIANRKIVFLAARLEPWLVSTGGSTFWQQLGNLWRLQGSDWLESITERKELEAYVCVFGYIGRSNVQVFAMWKVYTTMSSRISIREILERIEVLELIAVFLWRVCWAHWGWRLWKLYVFRNFRV